MAPNSFILLEQFLTKQVITKVATNQLPDSRNQYQKKPTSGGEDDMVPNSFILPPRAVLTRRNHQKVRDKSTAWLSESIAKNSPWAVAATMWYLWIWGGHGTKSLHPSRNPISLGLEGVRCTKVFQLCSLSLSSETSNRFLSAAAATMRYPSNWKGHGTKSFHPFGTRNPILLGLERLWHEILLALLFELILGNIKTISISGGCYNAISSNLWHQILSIRRGCQKLTSLDLKSSWLQTFSSSLFEQAHTS